MRSIYYLFIYQHIYIYIYIYIYIQTWTVFRQWILLPHLLSPLEVQEDKEEGPSLDQIYFTTHPPPPLHPPQSLVLCSLMPLSKHLHPAPGLSPRWYQSHPLPRSSVKWKCTIQRGLNGTSCVPTIKKSNGTHVSPQDKCTISFYNFCHEGWDKKVVNLKQREAITTVLLICWIYYTSLSQKAG